MSYLGWVLLLVWQALRGQSIVQPDHLTLGAFGLLVLTAIGAGLYTLRSAALSSGPNAQPARIADCDPCLGSAMAHVYNDADTREYGGRQKFTFYTDSTRLRRRTWLDCKTQFARRAVRCVYQPEPGSTSPVRAHPSAATVER